MIARIAEFLKKNAIVFTVSLVMSLISLNTFLVIYNKSELTKNNAIKHDTEDIIFSTNNLLSVAHSIDLGVRAYTA